jgi:hypothetical protein
MYDITVDRILAYDGTDADTAVAGTANAYTHSIKIARGTAFCLAYRAKSSTGTPDIDLYLQQTHIDPASVSDGENAAESVGNGWFQTATKIADITDETWHQVVISPLVAPYLRFFCDGQGANPADCTLELRLCKQAQD